MDPTTATLISMALDVALHEIFNRIGDMSQEQKIEEISKLRERKRKLVDEIRARQGE